MGRWRWMWMVSLMSCAACQGLRTAAPYRPSDYPSGEPASGSSGHTVVTLTEEALRIHHGSIVIDGHNDLPGEVRGRGDSCFEKLDLAVPQPELQTDIERLRRGGVGAQFWSAYVPTSTIEEGGGLRYGLEQIDLIRRMVAYYPDVFEMAYTADDIERIRRSGKIASLVGVEGGHAIENALGALRMFYDLGVRYLTLTHTNTTDWADSATDEARHGGLSDFGEEVIREMNRLGMLVDISHISADAMRDVLRVSGAPIIASHSSAYAIAQHPRNVPDDVLRQMPANGGLIMVNFFSGFVDPEGAKVTQDMFDVLESFRKEYPDETERKAAWGKYREGHPIPRGTVETVVDHIDHIVEVAGIDHVGLGSDFDGVTRLPVQLDDVSYLPFLTQALLDRGYDEGAIRKILGGNLIRALRQAESVAGS